MSARRFLQLTLLALTALGFGAVNAAAQATVAQTYFVSTTSGMGNQFEVAMATHMQWRKDNNDPWEWQAFQVVNGDGLTEYRFRSNGHAWADFDAYSAFQAEATEHFGNVVMPFVESITSRITTAAGFMRPEQPDQTPLYAITNFYLRPGQTPAFLAAIGQIHETFIETNHPASYIFETVVNGGRSDVVRLIIPHSSWADMEPLEPDFADMMIDVHGEGDATEVFEQLNAAILRSETSIITRRPDLSLVSGN